LTFVPQPPPTFRTEADGEGRATVFMTSEAWPEQLSVTDEFFTNADRRHFTWDSDAGVLEFAVENASARYERVGQSDTEAATYFRLARGSRQ
jgi:hypothetical protein